MGQHAGGNVCMGCRHWRPDALLARPVTGFCLRENIGCLANIATPVIETKALNVCLNFVARNAQESAASPGGFSDAALVICAGVAR